MALVPDVTAGRSTTGSVIPVPYGVVRKKRETHDTFSLLLQPVGSARLQPSSPGQFNMLYAFGVGESAISVSAEPAAPGRLWHTIREAGIVTGALDDLRKGDRLGLRGPFGSAWPLRDAEGGDLLIVAGGIGLAPLRPVIYHALAHRDRYRDINILYGARTPEDILYSQELTGWRGRFDLNVEVTVDRGDPAWRGEVGVVTTLIPTARFDPGHVTVMICGPEIMMRFVAREVLQTGAPEDAIFVSMERNMKCGIGLCGHCQFGPTFVCKDGPVFNYARVRHLMTAREI